MSLNDTPQGERPHISFFGRTNVGKSSLVNAVTGQSLSIVSEYRGTTTDPVQKAMEILPLGAVYIIDTPGLDDTGELGALRIERSRRVLAHTDLAVLVLEAGVALAKVEEELAAQAKAENIPLLVVANKADLTDAETGGRGGSITSPLLVSAKTGLNIALLREEMAQTLVRSRSAETKVLVRDLVGRGKLAVLVVPIDSAAPKGRLILPQQQVIRDLLEGGAMSLVVSPEELPMALKCCSPSLVICDSQVFAQVSEMTPEDIPLTSFSILMARYKGYLSEAVEGLSAMSRLKDGDCILMAEGCTHHRQCEDIGTVKIPRWLSRYTGKELKFATSSGRDFPEDLSPYALVILCGGCMLNGREMRYRIKKARLQKVPVTNYGIVIARMRGILERSTAMLDLKS